MFLLIVITLLAAAQASVPPRAVEMADDYFNHKRIQHLCYVSCDRHYYNKQLIDKFISRNMRVSMSSVRTPRHKDLDRAFHQFAVPVGVLLDGACDGIQQLLLKASEHMLFDSSHYWLVVIDSNKYNTTQYIEHNFRELNISVDADIVVSEYQDGEYYFTDVFNYGKFLNGDLIMNYVGMWNATKGLSVINNSFKYYDRWDFNNLTMRAVSVVLGDQTGFHPEMLFSVKYTPGINKMTKIPSTILEVLKKIHNFRFNYTIAAHWTGPTARNSALAVTNTIYWGEQDISSTGARMFPNWFQWVDIFFPPLTSLETKFYYLIPDKGIGEYDNRFLTPMSTWVWYSMGAAGALCALVLAIAAMLENRPMPSAYAVFSVLAATCQQAYEDGMNSFEYRFLSQGRRLTLLVIGLTSMVLYNYYTSSVVSWLLSAAAPTIDTIEKLSRSDLELVFEDIGYTKSWLEYPGFFYYNGIKDVKEDKLREAKVINGRRTVPLTLSVEDGIKVIQKGGYAYHTEPYTASQEISRRFREPELCALGSVQMIRPALVYIYAPKRSPYKQFFVWSLMRMYERGHVSAAAARIGGGVPACSGRTPRALALGQAAPAFLLLLHLAALSLLLLLLEMMCHRFWRRPGRR